MRKVCLLAVLVISCLFPSAKANEVQLPVINMMSEHFRTYDLRGEAYSDGSIHIWATTANGARLFDSRYPVQKPDGKYLQWQYEGETAVTQSTPVPDSTIPSLEGMFFASRDVVKMLGGGEKPADGSLVIAPTGERLHLAPLDDFGCDGFGGVSCTNKGICCDIHDQCYADNGCRALSWLGLGSPACIGCNIDAVACFASPIPFGPSACCYNGTCGQPRNPPPAQGGSGGDDGRNPQNVDPGLGGYGGGGGFSWSWTPYGGVSVSYSGFCVIRGDGWVIYVACG
jgi:hypothetical protein